MIGMFDSGIGGLTILDVLKEVLPKEDYLYYADSKNNPCRRCRHPTYAKTYQYIQNSAAHPSF